MKMQNKVEQWVEKNRDSMIKDIVNLVNIKSVKGEKEGIYTFGEGVGNALETALEIAGNAGFDTWNEDYYYGLVTLPGKTSEKIGIFTHLDVVPEGSGWQYAPYRAVVKDGYIIGRGSGDNKGPAMAALYALRYLKEQQIQLNKTIELYFGCAEEQGMEDIAYYKEHCDLPLFSFTPDVAFPVSYAEKGILELCVKTDFSSEVLMELEGGYAENMVAPEAKAVLNDKTVLKAVGIGKHAAFPEGSENAIFKLCKELLQIEELEPEAREKIKIISETLQDYYGESLGIPYEDCVTGKLTHTCGIAKIRNGELEANYNIRYPVQIPAEEMKTRLRERFEKNGFRIMKLYDNPPAFVSPDSKAVEELNAICNRVLGTELKPYTMGGGTYARKLPNAVGYGPGRNDHPVQWGNGHEPDECVRISDLEHAVRIYVEALIKLDQII